MIRPATLSDGQERILHRFDEGGGVVDFQIFDAADETLCGEALHRLAMLEGMKQIQQRSEDYAERTSKQMGIPNSKIYQVSVDWDSADEITGTKIDHQTFLGARYSFARGGLIVHGKSSPFLNDFSFYKDEPKKENIIASDGIDNGIGTGFAYACSSPPYSMQITANELGELFEQIIRFILGGVDDATVIFTWPTNWTNYFDAGDEWWGSFLWTVANPGSKQIVMIAASSTD